MNKKEQFLNRVDTLFKDIQTWLKDTNLTIDSEQITISEQSIGEYTCPKLIIQNQQGKKIAQIIPIGASVIGAFGRIDIHGLYDNEIILYFNQGGPQMTFSDNGKQITRPYYRGIDKDGWYCLEDKRNKAQFLDPELFFDLLSEVSDYESN